MAGKFILETERLLLREFDEGDAPVFFALGSNPAITRYTGDGGLTGIEHALAVLRARPMADYAKYGFGRWACVLKESNRVVGFAGLKYLGDLQEVDIGYRLLPEYWGLGLATEASRAAVHYGFAHLGLEQIIGLVVPANVASVRVLEKIGLKFTGMVKNQGQDLAKYVIQATAASRAAR